MTMLFQKLTIVHCTLSKISILIIGVYTVYTWVFL